MSFFTKKNFLFKLIVSICIVLAIMNGIGGQKVYAGIGGILISPICDLLNTLGDGIMEILQKSIMGTTATISIENANKTEWWEVFAAVVIVAVAVITFGVGTVLFAVSLAAAVAAIATGSLTVIEDGIESAVSVVKAAFLPDVVILPMFTIGPEEIFSGKILLFDANIFNPKEVYVEYNAKRMISLEDFGDETTEDDISEFKSKAGKHHMPLSEWKSKQEEMSKDDKYEYQVIRYYYEKDGEEVTTSINNSAYELRNVISKWYYIIRNIALVGSMLTLLYVGIRMITSSIAAEKAKYKEMLMDWVIAICLIFLMHYIMIFAHSVVESITDIVDNVLPAREEYAYIVEPEDDLIEGVEKIEKETGQTFLNDDNTIIQWPTNQMGRFRVAGQQNNETATYVGYTLAYLALVLYTFIFSVTYIKRLLYLLFLTVISPFVALTYPIDKISDGKAQAFNMWLKEYIFNLLIQPFHLLIYTIFVTMAYDLASTNIIYSLVVIGFIIPAEKFLRTMFGFNKASTPGFLAGAAGAALTMNAVKSLGNFAKGERNQRRTDGKDQEKQPKLRTADSSHSQSNLYADVARSENDTGTEESTDEQNDSQDNNIPGSNTERGGRNLAAERGILEEFRAEGATSGDWTPGDFDALQELQDELEQEEKQRQQEPADSAGTNNNAVRRQEGQRRTEKARRIARTGFRLAR